MRRLCAAFAFLLCTAQAHAESINGLWQGIYVCPQGATYLRLSIAELGKGQVEAVFSFSPTPESTAPASGCFAMTGEHDRATGWLKLNQKSWIDQPAGYIMVDMEGWIDPVIGSYDGEIKTEGCTVFGVKRQSVSKPDLNAACSLPNS